MITIWYNPNNKSFYEKIVRSAYFYSYYQVGYENQYNHKLVAMYFIDEDNHLISCKSFADYYTHKKQKSQAKKNKKLRYKIINKLVSYLERSL